MIMLKSSNWIRNFWRAGVLFCLAASASFAASADPQRPKLDVYVNVPPTWNLLVDDRISEMFVDAVRELLVRRGYAGDVEEVRFVDDPAKVPHLLTINLMEWRMQRTGAINCTLTASLQTPRGTKHLGIYHDTAFHWMGSGRWGLARSFDEAASGALNRMCDDIVRSELLPALPRRPDGRDA